MRKLRKYIFFALLVLILITAFCNLYINISANRHLYNNLNSLPVNEYGLVLGTNKYLSKGGINKYFVARILAVSDLYKASKINKVLVSGYKESVYYNEPLQIKKMLLKLGIPDSVIILDTAGFRTIQSVKNLNKMIANKNITIISQKFHNQRAVYLAIKSGRKAIGYNVSDARSFDDIITYIREIFAKTLAFFEVNFNSI